MKRIASLVFLLCPFALSVTAQQASTAATEATPAKRPADAVPPASKEALEVLKPFFERVKGAKTTRANVVLTAETIIDGAIVGTQESTYQIASLAPHQYTVYLRDATQRTRLFCDGERATLALSPTAYTHLDKAIGMQDAVFGLPFALGPYPEVVLATTLAGVDPALTLGRGMKSITVIDRGKFRGKTPAIHLRGVQDDNVSWDFWLSQEKSPTPLRLQVDLTQMLRDNGELELPAGYKYLLRFDYAEWKIDLKTDPALFRYRKLKDAKEYASVQAYAEAEKARKEKADK